MKLFTNSIVLYQKSNLGGEYMINKRFTLIFLSLLVLSACQNEGSQSQADAIPEPKVESAVEEAVTETNVSLKEDDEVKPLPVTSENREDQTNQQDISSKEKVVIDGYEYILIMEEAEYPNLTHLISAAKNYGAQLYGIAYSDVFAILKEGKTIAHMSAGYKSVLPEHAEMVKAMFSDEYSGIQEDIDFVIKNNIPLEKELYSISLNNGWLEINYM